MKYQLKSSLLLANFNPSIFQKKLCPEANQLSVKTPSAIFYQRCLQQRQAVSAKKPSEISAQN
jgi:hypothetical protein